MHCLFIWKDLQQCLQRLAPTHTCHVIIVLLLARSLCCCWLLMTVTTHSGIECIHQFCQSSSIKICAVFRWFFCFCYFCNGLIRIHFSSSSIITYFLPSHHCIVFSFKLMKKKILIHSREKNHGFFRTVFGWTVEKRPLMLTYSH